MTFSEPVQPSSGSASPSPERPEARRRKTLRLRQSKIDRAMKALGTRTETETIEQALDFVCAQQAMLDAVDAMYGAAIENVFDDEDAT